MFVMLMKIFSYYFSPNKKLQVSWFSKLTSKSISELTKSIFEKTDKSMKNNLALIDLYFKTSQKMLSLKSRKEAGNSALRTTTSLSDLKYHYVKDKDLRENMSEEWLSNLDDLFWMKDTFTTSIINIQRSMGLRKRLKGRHLVIQILKNLVYQRLTHKALTNTLKF